MGRSIAALALGFVALISGGRSAYANDLDVMWTAPHDCPDREALRRGLSRRVGREVAFGDDAPLGFSGAIVTHASGYELDLETRSRAGSDHRKLQARSCSELARASLLIAALLLSAAPDDTPAPAASAARASAHSSPARDAARWFMFVRARAIGDLGSLASASVGPGVGLGFGVDRTLFELGALLLPSREFSAGELGSAPGSLQLMAASAGICHEIFDGPTLAPCVQFELGRLRGRGRELASATAVSTTWVTAGAGARASVRLFDALYCVADLRGVVPLARPSFGVHGFGPVHEVPALIGRFELSLEGRL